MYGKMIKIGEKEIWVYCTPNTPLSEILERAVLQLKKKGL